MTPRVEKLAAQAAEAAELRALATNPDVVALGVEKVRRQVSVMSWSGILLGLAFTMTNVQQFAADRAPAWTLPWCAAWLLDPMVSLVLVALLRTEQVAARWQVRPGPWVRRARWFTLAATYGMNTWTAWTLGAPSWVWLHSVPVLLVFFGSEAITDAHEVLTRAVYTAATARQGTPAQETTPGPQDHSGSGPGPLPDHSRTTPEQVQDQDRTTEPDTMPETPWEDLTHDLGPEWVPEQTPAALPEQDPPNDTGPGDSRTRKQQARDWYLTALDDPTRTEPPTPTEVNRAVGTNGYIKRPMLDEWRAEQHGNGHRVNGHQVGVGPSQ